MKPSSVEAYKCIAIPSLELLLLHQFGRRCIILAYILLCHLIIMSVMLRLERKSSASRAAGVGVRAAGSSRLNLKVA